MKINENDIADLDDFDFGFTAIDENDLKPVEDLQIYKDKLYGLRDMIMPLLKNLKANPDKDYILWPDRQKKIDEFIKKMNKFIEQ